MKIAFIVIFSLIGVIALILKLIRVDRENTIKKWKVGDQLILSEPRLENELTRNKAEYAILRGWSMDEVIVDMGSNYIRTISHSDIDQNKSMKWRQIYERCETVMDGQKPGFSSEIGQSATSNLKIGGKDIDLLTETELQVQLQISLKNEEYTLAEVIRKKLEKFR